VQQTSFHVGKRNLKEKSREVTSFSITAMRFPCWLVKMWFSRVVFPLPRNPVITYSR
jgi:hypothetical protein